MITIFLIMVFVSVIVAIFIVFFEANYFHKIDTTEDRLSEVELELNALKEETKRLNEDWGNIISALKDAADKWVEKEEKNA